MMGYTCTSLHVKRHVRGDTVCSVLGTNPLFRDWRGTTNRVIQNSGFFSQNPSESGTKIGVLVEKMAFFPQVWWWKPTIFPWNFPEFWMAKIGSGEIHHFRHRNCGTSAALAGTPETRVSSTAVPSGLPSVEWPLLDHLMPIVTAGKDFAPEKSWIVLDIKCQLYNLYPTLVSNISIQHVGCTSIPHIFWFRKAPKNSRLKSVAHLGKILGECPKKDAHLVNKEATSA